MCPVPLTPSFSSGNVSPRQIWEVLCCSFPSAEIAASFPAVMNPFFREPSLAVSAWHPGLLVRCSSKLNPDGCFWTAAELLWASLTFPSHGFHSCLLKLSDAQSLSPGLFMRRRSSCPFVLVLFLPVTRLFLYVLPGLKSSRLTGDPRLWLTPQTRCSEESAVCCIAQQLLLVPAYIRGNLQKCLQTKFVKC